MILEALPLMAVLAKRPALSAWVGRKRSRKLARQKPRRRRTRLTAAEIRTLQAGHAHTRQQRRRDEFERQFALITDQFGGEPRKIRRAMARYLAKRGARPAERIAA